MTNDLNRAAKIGFSVEPGRGRGRVAGTFFCLACCMTLGEHIISKFPRICGVIIDIGVQKSLLQNQLEFSKITLDIKGLAFASHSVAQLTEDLLANTPCFSDFNSSHSPGNPLNSIIN